MVVDTLRIWDLDKLNLVMDGGLVFRLEIILAPAPAASNMTLASKVFKIDSKIMYAVNLNP